MRALLPLLPLLACLGFGIGVATTNFRVSRAHAQTREANKTADEAIKAAERLKELVISSQRTTESSQAVAERSQQTSKMLMEDVVELQKLVVVWRDKYIESRRACWCALSNLVPHVTGSFGDTPNPRPNLDIDGRPIHIGRDGVVFTISNAVYGVDRKIQTKSP